MEGIQPDRKRAALSTVGRGSRGLLGLWAVPSPVILAGTAVARTESNLHILQLDTDVNEINQCFVVPTPSEVWSLDLVPGKAEDTTFFCATRQGHQSSVDVWTLKGLGNLSTEPLDLSSTLETHDGDVRVEREHSVAIDGQILNVCKNSFDTTSCLGVSDLGASIFDQDGALKVSTSFSMTGKEFADDGHNAKVVAGDWIDANSIVLATAKAIGVFDVRSGKASSCIDVKDAAAKLKVGADVEEDWVPLSAAGTVSACSDGENIVHVGGQDGYIRAIDLRVGEVVWQAPHAFRHWVSALKCCEKGLLSGGTDGVVRSWTHAGDAVATFPQHDDTVTNLCCSSKAFASVSYDGRIAVNEMPTGL